MSVSLERDALSKIILVGDRVLIKPKSPEEKTTSGLFLPAGVHEQEKTNLGYVISVAHGYAIPALQENDEPWKPSSGEVKYLPLQPKTGDLAVYLQKNGYEIEFNREKYIIVPHSAILMLVRDEELFED
jgi:co-chaperonin GroES (HSP10)